MVVREYVVNLVGFMPLYNNNKNMHLTVMKKIILLNNFMVHKLISIFLINIFLINVTICIPVLNKCNRNLKKISYTETDITY